MSDQASLMQSIKYWKDECSKLQKQLEEQKEEAKEEKEELEGDNEKL